MRPRDGLGPFTFAVALFALGVVVAAIWLLIVVAWISSRAEAAWIEPRPQPAPAETTMPLNRDPPPGDPWTPRREPRDKGRITIPPEPQPQKGG